MSNNRNWTWADENAELSDEQRDELEPTLNALAAEWSDIHNEIEQEGWRAQARYEDGDGPEDPECPHCSDGYLGRPYRGDWCFTCAHCHDRPSSLDIVYLICPWCKGDGRDHQLMDEWAKKERQRVANREVRQEIIEGMLEKYGARMCRPYEHWNEDERYMEYMECGRFGE